MSTPVRPQQICIGLSIEGAMLRLAVVGRTGLKLNVMDLASMPLPVKQFTAGLEDGGEAAGGGSKDNPFDDVGTAESETTSGENIDFSSIREFLSTHFQPRATFSLGFEVPHLRTLLLPVDKKDTPAKIRTKVVEEVQNSLNVELDKRALAFTK
ncbi:MAG: hypothetical protein RRA94_06830, partial [Bacteroidota bacterium]|nr:hypothetical protein [Bacteroidota bacterium]